jgi:hypothetical protein
MSVDAKERIELLATCDLMRHLPAEQIEQILPCIRERQLKAVGFPVRMFGDQSQQSR